MPRHWNDVYPMFMQLPDGSLLDIYAPGVYTKTAVFFPTPDDDGMYGEPPAQQSYAIWEFSTGERWRCDIDDHPMQGRLITPIYKGEPYRVYPYQEGMYE